MKILVACEESQAVTKELRALGHEAYSCDIIDQSGGHPEWHIMQDVLPLINGNCHFNTTDEINHSIEGKWDMIIAFPPCTYLTNAGALIADESPIRWSRLFCTRWNGLNKSGGTMDAFDDAEYEGSVISLIENGEAFIKRNAKMMWRKTPNSREEMPEYVERSYHEALINALVHRDYLVNGSEVHIDIYDDRMEIYSPGGMADGSIIQERDPLTVPSTRRNPVLADIFNRLGYMERKGSGFGKIIGGYEFQVNYEKSKRPKFRSDRYQFTVVMPNLNYGEYSMSEDDYLEHSDLKINIDLDLYVKLREYMKEPRTRAELQDFCKISSRDYFRTKILNPLVTMQKVRLTIPEKPTSSKQKYVWSDD